MLLLIFHPPNLREGKGEDEQLTMSNWVERSTHPLLAPAMKTVFQNRILKNQHIDLI